MARSTDKVKLLLWHAFTSPDEHADARNDGEVAVSLDFVRDKGPEAPAHDDVPALAVVLLELRADEVRDVGVDLSLEARLVEALLGRCDGELDFFVRHVLREDLRRRRLPLGRRRARHPSKDKKKNDRNEEQ